MAMAYVQLGKKAGTPLTNPEVMAEYDGLNLVNDEKHLSGNLGVIIIPQLGGNATTLQWNYLPAERVSWSEEEQDGTFRWLRWFWRQDRHLYSVPEKPFTPSIHYYTTLFSSSDLAHPTFENRVVTASSGHKVSGTSMQVQPTSHSEKHAPSSAKGKRRKRKAKRKNQQLQPTVLPTHTSAASLLTCPAEVLLLIIGFIGRAERRTINRHLFNLRLVNREFSRLLQPIIYESVRVPRKYSRSMRISGEYDEVDTVTKDIRKLLRLIDGNPSLAKDINKLTYCETAPYDMTTDYYSSEELDEDCNIFLRLAGELSQKSPMLVLSVRSSDKDKISRQYDNICAPQLLTHLTNLRNLSFEGHVGGGYALLLTPLAKQIWEHLPLKSLDVLCWQSLMMDDDYNVKQWPAHDLYDDEYCLDETEPQDNDWNIIFLTAMDIQSVNPEQSLQCLLQLVKCTAVLKTLKIYHPPDDPVLHDALQLKQALQLVRNCIEEIKIHGMVKWNSSVNGGIGPFHDFPKLRKLSTDVMGLVQFSPLGWPGNGSIVEEVPPNLESLCLYIFETIFFFSATQPVHEGNLDQSEWVQKRFWRLNKILQDVLRLRKTGRWAKFRRIRIRDNLWASGLLCIPEESTGILSELCKTLGIEYD
ncbi:hypothetical protein BZA77DRAFT_291871 [Pyronema omphalodes]|nr:hypothetical protein BZA77DRAFT_296901 [Pyronema omphalodes]KAI5817940.1 hypothetical protein BZA77DRAFT_291871 [Pyronema omphalodes]